MRLGFDYFDVPSCTAPTTKEILAGMTAEQKVDVLTAFKTRVSVPVAARQVLVSKAAIKHLYGKIKEIELMARAYMRGEIVIDPGNPTAEPPVPPTYNTPPSTSAALINLIKNLFVEDFTSGQVTAILTAMVKYSKRDGTGDWNYYKNSVVV